MGGQDAGSTRGLIDRMEAFCELLKWHGGTPFAKHWPLIEEAISALKAAEQSDT